jgi:hypothetical protein
MPYVIRGIVDDALASYNRDTGLVWEDPMPKMSQLWEKYNEVCCELTRSSTPMYLLKDIAKNSVDFVREVKNVFPDQSGPRGKKNAWNSMKIHDFMMHMTSSILMFGRTQVSALYMQSSLCL